MYSHAGGIAWVAASGLIARFGEGAGINPVAAEGCAVVLQPGKAGNLLSGLDLLLGGRIFQIGQSLAVDFLQYFGQRGAGGIAVIPSQVENGIGELTAFFFVE